MSKVGKARPQTLYKRLANNKCNWMFDFMHNCTRLGIDIRPKMEMDNSVSILSDKKASNTSISEQIEKFVVNYNYVLSKCEPRIADALRYLREKGKRLTTNQAMAILYDTIDIRELIS